MGVPGGSDGKEFSAMQETWVASLGWEDPLEKGMATHSSILAWRISMDRGAQWGTVHGITNSWTWLSNQTQIYIFGEGNGNPLQYSCPENPMD